MTVSTSFEVSRYACRTLPRDIFCWSNMEDSVAQTPSSDNMKTGGANFAGYGAKMPICKYPCRLLE